MKSLSTQFDWKVISRKIRCEPEMEHEEDASSFKDLVSESDRDERRTQFDQMKEAFDLDERSPNEWKNSKPN